jgi:hypothetical protein
VEARGLEPWTHGSASALAKQGCGFQYHGGTWHLVKAYLAFLSWLEACTQGYPVCRVPTVAPRPTSGEAVNPHVGPTFFSPCGFLFSLKLSLDCWCSIAPLPWDRCAHLIGVSCQSIMADEHATMAVPRWQGPVIA